MTEEEQFLRLKRWKNRVYRNLNGYISSANSKMGKENLSILQLEAGIIGNELIWLFGMILKPTIHRSKRIIRLLNNIERNFAKKGMPIELPDYRITEDRSH